MTTEFTRISQAASANIQKFSYNCQQVQNYVVKIGTPQDSDQVRGELLVFSLYCFNYLPVYFI